MIGFHWTMDWPWLLGAKMKHQLFEYYFIELGFPLNAIQQPTSIQTEFATIINSCGRLGEYRTGIDALFDDEDDSKSPF